MKRTLFATVGFGMLSLGRFPFGFNTDPDDQTGGGDQQESDAPTASEPDSIQGDTPSAEPPVVNGSDASTTDESQAAEEDPVDADVVSEDANATKAGENAAVNDDNVDGADQYAPADRQEEAAP